ncbi:MAG TPA: hypothetical protein VFE04_07405 [Puia sp.]|jgi:hypothetical protein|nr:hypothetical protein [Puia sp.]
MANRNGKIIQAGLIAGTLDILSAFIYYYIKTGKTNFLVIFKFIASGIFGKAAGEGGTVMILAGLILHYAIAFAFTIFFFWLYPKMNVMSKNRLVTAIVYGLFVWCVMNLVVVPLSNTVHRPFNLANAVINICILIVCIGLPLSFMANAFFGKHSIKL